jgi:hypothetical protein
VGCGVWGVGVGKGWWWWWWWEEALHVTRSWPHWVTPPTPSLHCTSGVYPDDRLPGKIPTVSLRSGEAAGLRSPEANRGVSPSAASVHSYPSATNEDGGFDFLGNPFPSASLSPPMSFTTHRIWFLSRTSPAYFVIDAFCFAGLGRALVVMVQWACRMAFHTTRYTVIRLQSWWRCMFHTHTFLGTKYAVRRIERAVLAHVRAKVLAAWCQEFHGACTWGDVGKAARCWHCVLSIAPSCAFLWVLCRCWRG